ncbi:hypothetical protein [Flavobacterium sp. SM2513]|uniref:hypothetical protein n=1 Tax=Flavobacterium sp. SM2513 TaxID=3424766 RepID=UPI003D7F7BA6
MENINNLPKLKIGFEQEMNLKADTHLELFLQYYLAKMLDGIFNELSRIESVSQKLNWINDSIKKINKKDDGKESI